MSETINGLQHKSAIERKYPTLNTFLILIQSKIKTAHKWHLPFIQTRYVGVAELRVFMTDRSLPQTF